MCANNRGISCDFGGLKGDSRRDGGGEGEVKARVKEGITAHFKVPVFRP